MMQGSVNARLEAKFRLTLIGPTGIRQDVDAVIDTGFTGSLTMPTPVIAALALVRRSSGTATLGDGSTCNYDNFAAEVEWGGIARGVVVSAIGNEVLIGMTLLTGHRLIVDVEDAGSVEVRPLRP
ncbi:MAG TPA: hypothetical protein VHR66_12530 [Gemmataceae bacterium]|jgi:predicted aspartyl protease|nr:hypothetical protein [Gemmataceae bacterium]